MDNQLTTVKDDLPGQGGSNVVSNNPAGMETEKPYAGDDDKPGKVKPETEKPEVKEMPDTKEEPEVEKTDIEEVPDTEPPELPDTGGNEIPDTDIEEIPKTT